MAFVCGQFVVDSGCIAATSQQGLAWKKEFLQDELQAVPGEKKERRTTRRRSIFRTMRFGSFFFRPRTSKRSLQKLEHTGLWLPRKRNWDCHSLRQQQRTWAESGKWRRHNNEVQKQKLRKEKLLRLRQRCTCSAVLVDRSPCTSGIVSVYYWTKACGWNPRFLHSFELKGLSGREREGKTDKRSTVCVDGSPKLDPSSCRMDQMRTIHGGVFRLSNSTLHSVSSKVTGKLIVSLQPFQWSFCKITPQTFIIYSLQLFFLGFHFLKLNKKTSFVSFWKFQTLKATVVMGSRDQVLHFQSSFLLHSFTPENLKSISWVEVVNRTQKIAIWRTLMTNQWHLYY